MDIVASENINLSSYSDVLTNSEKFAKCLENLCKNTDFYDIPKHISHQAETMAHSFAIMLKKLKRAYILHNYVHDQNYISDLSLILQKITKLKRKLKFKNCQTALPQITYSNQKQFCKLRSYYLRAKRLADNVIDTSGNSLLYNKKSWPVKSVLVGTLRNSKQLDIAIKNRFYHIPKSLIENPGDIKCIAVYQSKNLFDLSSGIKYYGKVQGYVEVPRYSIKEIPSKSDEYYIRFEIEEWKIMKRPLKADYLGDTCIFTTLFQLMTSEKSSELLLCDQDEYNLYMFMKDHTLTDAMAIFSAYEKDIIYTGKDFEIYREEKLVGKITNHQFLKSGVYAVSTIRNLT